MTDGIARRAAALDWAAIGRDLDEHGCAVAGPLLEPAACEGIAVLFDAETGFRSRVVMARHGYGRGEYRYFAYPLPPAVAALRRALYPPLAVIANRWNAALGNPVKFPDDLPAFLARCHAAGQTRPTPLMLDYGPGDYNRLHQDLYGEHVFPVQAVILLSAPDQDFTGGELVLTEQRTRMQSRARGRAVAAGLGRVCARAHAPCARRARPVARRHAPRREPRALRPPTHARHHLPRRDVSLRYRSS